MGIPGIGFLPDAWAEELVRYTRGIPYGGIRLLGAPGLTDGLTRAGFRRVQVRPAVVGPAESALLGARAKLGARALRVATRVPGVELALTMLGPMLEVFAFKGPNREHIRVGR